MSYFDIYLWCALGIVISVILPIIWEAVYRYFPRPAPAGGPAAVAPALIAFWKLVVPYLVLGIASLITAILIVAAMGDKLTDFKAAILAGYAWDSTLQKLRR